jgi:hypothetical protein
VKLVLFGHIGWGETATVARKKTINTGGIKPHERFKPQSIGAGIIDNTRTENHSRLQQEVLTMKNSGKSHHKHPCDNSAENLMIDVQKIPVMISENPADWFLTEAQEAERDEFMGVLPERLMDKLIKERFRLVCRECFVRIRKTIRDQAMTLRHEDGRLCIDQCGRSRDQWFKDLMMDLKVERLFHSEGVFRSNPDDIFKSIVAGVLNQA